MILSEPAVTDRPQDFPVCKTKLSKDRSTNYHVHIKGCKQQAKIFCGIIIYGMLLQIFSIKWSESFMLEPFHSI